MGSDVYANGRSISNKSGMDKVNAAFPDVCLSPPSPPAGPIPIPYPLFSVGSDTSSGSKNVKINKKEVMLRDKSYYKKSKGDEACTKSFGQGIITHTAGGKVFFISWSMDVKVEGKNVVRHLDMTTSNHSSPQGTQSVPWPNLANAAFKTGGKCEGVDTKLKLRKYSKGCPQGQTPHHLIPDRCCRNYEDYSHSAAPCVCVKGKSQHVGSHKLPHSIFDPYELEHHEKGRKFTYKKARDKAAESAGGALKPPRKLTAVELECVKFQLDLYYKQERPKGPGFNETTELDTYPGEGTKVAASCAPF